jgi:hypothetical protein
MTDEMNDILRNHLVFKDDALREWMLEMLDFGQNTVSLKQALDELMPLHNDLSSSIDFVSRLPYCSLVLCYVCYRGEKFSDSATWAMDAIIRIRKGFENLAESQNYVVAHWLHGLASEKAGLTVDAEHSISEGIKRIQWQLNDCKRRGQWTQLEQLEVIHRQLKEMECRLKGNRHAHYVLSGPKAPSPSSDTITPDPTPLTKNALTISSPKLLQTSPNERSVSKPANTRPGESLLPDSQSSIEITIPVDIRALTPPSKKPEQLDGELYDLLRAYNKLGIKQRQQSENKQFSELENRKKFIIPPFPIYAQVIIGTAGQVIFEELDRAHGVCEDCCTEFAGLKYKVYSTQHKGGHVAIRPGTTYAWMNVEGNSMNLAGPVPIDDHDYVLFYRTRNCQSCEGKIVVALQPALAEPHPLLLIKRLLAMTRRSKEFSSIAKKYYLHSDSSMEVYRDDIELTKDNQLIGEVVAVAKPVR